MIIFWQVGFGLWLVMLHASLGRRERTPTTVAVNRFLKYTERFADNTQRRYRDTLSLFLAEMPEFLSDICPEHLDKFILRPGLNNNSRNVILTVLRSFYKYLEDYHGLPNIAEKVKYLRKEPSKQRVISSIELSQILKIARPKEQSIIRFLAFTGIRAQEFCDLRPGSISPDSKYITVIGKGRKKRNVPLNKTCRECWPDIFYKKWTRDKLSWLCKKLSKKAGIPLFYPHALRHYFVTELVKRGVPIAIVSKIVGHASPEITFKCYCHLFTPDVLGFTDCLEL